MFVSRGVKLFQTQIKCNNSNNNKISLFRHNSKISTQFFEKYKITYITTNSRCRNSQLYF